MFSKYTHLSDNNPDNGSIISSALILTVPINVSFHSFSSHVKLNLTKKNKETNLCENKSYNQSCDIVIITSLRIVSSSVLYTNSLHFSMIDWLKYTAGQTVDTFSDPS